jgi:integrase
MCKLAKAGAKYFEFPMEKPVNGPIEPLPEDDRASADRESVDLALLLEAQLDARDKSPITLRGYQFDFSQFVRWCNRNGVSALPADVLSIVSYLTEASQIVTKDGAEKYSHRTLTRWVTSINHTHAASMYPPPGNNRLVSKTLRSIRRNSSREPRERRALLAVDIARIEDSLSYDTAAEALKSIRDACLFRVGFEGAFRRGELAGIQLRHIEINDRGATIRLPKSKTDQLGEGFTKYFIRQDDPRRCSVCALSRQILVRNASLSSAEDLEELVIRLSANFHRHICSQRIKYVDGSASLFTPVVWGRIRQKILNPTECHRAIMARLISAGYDPKLYGSHSLRIGFVTQAALNGATNDEIKRQTGQKSDEVLNVYKRDVDAYRQSAIHLIYGEAKFTS